MSLTDNEIIKALEKAANADCNRCSFNNENCDGEDCDKYIAQKILDLINRLQAEKEALIAGQETLQKALAEKDNEIKRLQERNIILRGAVDTQKNDNKRLAGYLADSISHEPRSEAEIKAEAYKEIIEKLKSKLYICDDNFNPVVTEKEIDDTFKEMAGASDA